MIGWGWQRAPHCESSRQTKPLGQAITPQGSPGHGFGVSEVGQRIFGQPATTAASEMNADGRSEPSPV